MFYVFQNKQKTFILYQLIGLLCLTNQFFYSIENNLISSFTYPRFFELRLSMISRRALPDLVI